AEERDEQLFDDGFLPDDHLAQLSLEVVVTLLEFLDRGEFVGGEVGGLRLDDPDLRLLFHLGDSCRGGSCAALAVAHGRDKSRPYGRIRRDYTMPARPKLRTRLT